jgi:cytochrome c553
LTPALAQNASQAEKIQLCSACHGEDGNSKIDKIPSLAGQPAFFILNQLFLMREGVRKVEAMAPIVKDLKDDDLNTLSQHFAKLEAKRSDEVIDPALAKKGAEIATQRRCGSCHLPSLAGQDQMPRVARQRIDYLVEVLKSYRDNPRPGADTAMSVPVSGASDADLVALAHYAASL